MCVTYEWFTRKTSQIIRFNSADIITHCGIVLANLINRNAVDRRINLAAIIRAHIAVLVFNVVRSRLEFIRCSQVGIYMLVYIYVMRNLNFGLLATNRRLKKKKKK